MSISVHLEEAILQKIFRGENFDVSQIFVSLHSGDPGRTGASELSGSGYKRQPVAFDRDLKNDKTVEFRDLRRSTITHAGLWDAVSQGHFLWGTDLGERHAVGEGWNFEVRKGLISGPSIQ